MTKNLMPEVLKMLGVEYGEKFKLHAQDLEVAENDLYCFDEDNGLVRFYKDNSTCFVCEMLYDILIGYYEIVKLPWEPKKNDLVWYPSTSSKKVRGFPWNDSMFNLAIKSLGMIYRTREEAEAHFAEDYERLTGKKLE